jgi:hypothetical protein
MQHTSRTRFMAMAAFASPTRWGRTSSIVATLLLTSGCGVSTPPQPSSDMGQLNDIIRTDLMPNTGRWETFNTPEYVGGVPGTSDMTTLVAELPLTKDAVTLYEGSPLMGKHFIAPESARAWLTPHFKEMMAANKNASANMGDLYSCRRLDTHGVKSGKRLDSFVCRHDQMLLIYVTLNQQEA